MVILGWGSGKGGAWQAQTEQEQQNNSEYVRLNREKEGAGNRSKGSFFRSLGA